MIYRFKYNCTYLTRYKVMIKNRQARLQQYVNCEHPDIQAVFRKGRGSRDQIANICWIIHGVDHFHFSLSCTGEGNGNPFQCSCLENPRDGGAGGLPSMGLHRVGHDWSNLAAVVGSSKKQESSRKTSTSALLTMAKPLTVCITQTVENS